MIITTMISLHRVLISLSLGLSLDPTRIPEVPISCPYASGAATHVKATHLSWSPATIKSTLITIVYEIDPDRHENEEEFTYESGVLNPVRLCILGWSTMHLLVIISISSATKATTRQP